MRRFIVLSCATLAARVLTATASATPSAQRTFQRTGTLSFDCGAFQDIFAFTTTVHVLTFYDQTGAAVKQVFHVHRDSTDTNSATGKTLRSSADRIVAFDLVSGTTTIDGQNDNTTSPGQGVVVQDGGCVILAPGARSSSRVGSTRTRLVSLHRRELLRRPELNRRARGGVVETRSCGRTLRHCAPMVASGRARQHG